jgi:5-methylthioadenosine/S-adenosylhomocysteine deaminase
MAILIQGASYVVRSADRVELDRDVLIEGSRVAAVGRLDLAADPAATVIDGCGRAVIPGLINAHTHTYQNFLKGLSDDLRLVEWCHVTLYPMAYAIHQARWQRGDESCGYQFASLSALEMIRGGVTCCIDMNMNMDTVFQAWLDTGLRGVGAIALGDRWLPDALRRDPEVDKADALRLARTWRSAHSRLSAVFGPSTPFLCTRELLEWARDRAADLGIGLQIHLAETRYEVDYVTLETGLRPVAYAHSLGLLRPGVTAVHCVHVDDREIDLLAESGATVVHCPKSNLKLGSGIAPVVKMVRRGVPVALAADGAASNDVLDLFEETRMAALLHKGAGEDPTAITGRQAFRMATEGGARAAGIDAGTIDPGKLADLAIIDLDAPHLLPVHDIINTLVYCARADDVECTIIDGQIVMQDRIVRTVDEEKVRREASAFGTDLYRQGLAQWREVRATA